MAFAYDELCDRELALEYYAQVLAYRIRLDDKHVSGSHLWNDWADT